MNISEIFNLERTQQELDFVDIDIKCDTPLFIDPAFLSTKNDRWSINSMRTLKNFFQNVIDLINADKQKEAKLLFDYLSEPNETRLGLSKGSAQGKGVGEGDTISIFKNLVDSKAVESGLVEDLEDCVIFVEGFGRDKLSDMSTNIMKKHLIEYTQKQCKLWGIPLTSNVPSGFFWNRATKKWQSDYTDMLVINGEKILLVPKGIVSYSREYTPQTFNQHFVLNFLQSKHLSINSHLVQIRKVKKTSQEIRFVTKKSLKEEGHTENKETLRKFTEEHPSVFRDFKREVRNIKNMKPLTHEQFVEIQQGSEGVEDVIDYLIEKLANTPSGKDNATEYHRLSIGIMSLLFYPILRSPQVEQEIHEGRKRIDITFDNSANFGFFHSLHSIHKTPSSYIFIECKNYSSDPRNPELDQLAGRFSWNTGKFGILLCREIDNRNLFLTRCRDTSNDDRGIIIPLVDEDLIGMLNYKKVNNYDAIEKILTDRLREVKLG